MIKSISIGLVFLVAFGLIGTSHAQLFSEDFDTYSTWATGGVGTSMHSTNGTTSNGWQKGLYHNLRRSSGRIGPLGINGTQGFDPEPAELPPQGWNFRDITGEVNPNGNYMLRALVRSDVGSTSPQNISFKVGDAETTWGRYADSNELTVEFVMQSSYYSIDRATLKNGVTLTSIPSEEGLLCSDQGISSNWQDIAELPEGATPCRTVEVIRDDAGNALGEDPDAPNVPRYLFNYSVYGMWFEALMNVNTNSGTATVWYRDVDDTTGEALGAFEQLPGNFAQGIGSTILVGLPFTAPEAAGIRVARAADLGTGGVSLDNFISGHPLLANQGDFDGDGDIDGNDFLIWQNNFPNSDGRAISFSGDATGDGKVDGDDFLIWQNSFPYPAGLAKTPEPASLGLVALGGLLMLRRRAI